MFHATLIKYLRGIDDLAATVTEWNGRPAIFADAVPETVEEPYIQVHIGDNSPTVDRVIIESTITIDYIGYGVSRTTADRAGEILEQYLDHKVLQSERLTDIRINMSSCGYVQQDDPRVVHYNMIFSARGTRRKWMTTL